MSNTKSMYNDIKREYDQLEEALKALKRKLEMEGIAALG